MKLKPSRLRQMAQSQRLAQMLEMDERLALRTTLYMAATGATYAMHRLQGLVEVGNTTELARRSASLVLRWARQAPRVWGKKIDVMDLMPAEVRRERQARGNRHEALGSV
jgi:hypothetical protein